MSHGPRRPPSWAPSERETRKYASLFLRTDGDGDGFVEANEARDLCGCSGLGDTELARAWAHADQDRDGRLSFPEFIALVHAVTCATRGLSIPEEGPHPQLAQTLSMLRDSPEELHRQRSRSPSYATSTNTSRSVSPMPSQADLWAHRDAVPENWDIGQHAHIDASEAALDSSAAVGSPSQWPSSPPQSPSSPRFGGEHAPLARAEPKREPDLEMVRRHLAGMLEADRVAKAYAEREADRLEEQLTKTRADCERMRPQLVRDRDEGRRLANMLGQLDRQLRDSKRRLQGLQEKRRALRSSRHDVGRTRAARNMLEEALQEEVRLLEEMNRSNGLLKESCGRLAEDMAQFSSMREEILEQLAAEQELLWRSRLRHADIRERRNLGAAQAVNGQGLAPPPQVASPCSWTSRHSEPCAWASTLVTASLGGAGVVPVSAPRAAMMRPGI